MCIFGRSAPTPLPKPAPLQPRHPDLVRESTLPTKKELLDPDDVAGVEYGTSSKKSTTPGTRTGTDALKININTGAGAGAGEGGMNV